MTRDVRLNSFRVVALLACLSIMLPQANAYGWGGSTKAAVKIAKIYKGKNALPDEEIVRLSKLSDEVGGTKKVGKELGAMKLSPDLQEDTFLRITLYQQKFGPDPDVAYREAAGMYSRLSGTRGFSTTLRKVIGNSDVGTKGHLNELRIADQAAQHRMNVLAIGQKFDDGMKNSLTDVDVLIEKNGKQIALEAKDYAADTKMPLDKFRADLDTLNAYKEKSSKEVVPIFSFTETPTDPVYLKSLRQIAKSKNVELIFGPPEVQIELIKIKANI